MDLQLLNSFDLYKVFLLKFYHKYANGKLPAAFNYLSLNTKSENNQRITRQSNEIGYRTTKANYIDNALEIKIPILMNKSPDYFKSLAKELNYRIYTKFISSFYYNSYTAECSIHSCSMV